jgi:carboxyl-terminal processing protease
MSRSRLIHVVFLVLLLSVLTAVVKSGDIYFEIKKQLTIFSDVYKEIATLYVDEVPPETLMKNGINSMLDILDPYTTFVDEGEQQQMEILSTGNYGGVGIDAGYRENRIVVIAPYEGYPASRAGIHPGDIILEIDGVSTENMSPEEVQQLTIGDIGTHITLLIERRGIDQPIIFELQRERIEVRNIEYSDLIGNDSAIGYVRLTRFGQNTSGELREVLLEFRQNDQLKGLILDLRNNPGGLLNEAVHVVDKFIEPGELIVETRGRLQSQNNSFYSEEPPLFKDIPLIILLNSGSASASEVVAGALQDLDRAIIIGETSFGKGLVQTVRPLSYNTSLRLTVSKYYTPSGRSIQSIDYSRVNGIQNPPISDQSNREFRTKNGRKVIEGAGIEPDIRIEDGNASLLLTTLRQRNHFFFFVNDYLADQNPGESNNMPNRLFDLFVEYLENEEFDFRTSADENISRLKNMEDHFSDAQKADNLINELEVLINDQKKMKLIENRDQIENALMLEWIAGTQGEDEKLKESLPLDPIITQSLSVISNPDRYNRILGN